MRSESTSFCPKLGNSGIRLFGAPKACLFVVSQIHSHQRGNRPKLRPVSAPVSDALRCPVSDGPSLKRVGANSGQPTRRQRAGLRRALASAPGSGKTWEWSAAVTVYVRPLKKVVERRKAARGIGNPFGAVASLQATSTSYPRSLVDRCHRGTLAAQLPSWPAEFAQEPIAGQREKNLPRVAERDPSLGNNLQKELQPC